ncbi:MAG: fibronectin type III domain-containing protein [Candidatus Cloacimonetes bacterium]|nr:fibronectin type III domain-containing protein [Candidatus Cloacimonadota bacterium]
MQRLFITALFIFFICLCPAISSSEASGDFSMDTVDPQLQLLSPLGGEEWFIGESRLILWSASDDNFSIDPISLSYSIDGGLSYQDLAEGLANSGTYSWLLPHSQSRTTKVLVLARDSFGNCSSSSSNQFFSILYALPMSPENVTVEVISEQDAIISWDPVTITEPPSSMPITPDGYIVLFNDTPDQDEESYQFLGNSLTTSFTHHNVTTLPDRMFYRVVAYKNDSRESASAMKDLLQRCSEMKISWGKAKASLKGVQP